MQHKNTVMVLYIACTDCENDKIRLRSHSSLSWFRTSHVRTVRTIKSDSEAIKSVMVSYVACTDCENDKIRLFHKSRVQTVSVEFE